MQMTRHFARIRVAAHNRQAIRGSMRRSEIVRRLRSFVADERGATAVEYGLIIAGLAALLIGSLNLLGTSLSGRFSAVASGLAK